MSALQQTTPLIVTIPSLGECTLLPVIIMPEALRTYEKIRTTATELDLKEFYDLSRSQLSHIFNALTYKISERGVETSEGVTVNISGSCDAYPMIDIGDMHQKMMECVLSMDFFFWQNAYLLDSGELAGGPVEVGYSEVSVNGHISVLDGDSVYCLFKGT